MSEIDKKELQRIMSDIDSSTVKKALADIEKIGAAKIETEGTEELLKSNFALLEMHRNVAKIPHFTKEYESALSASALIAKHASAMRASELAMQDGWLKQIASSPKFDFTRFEIPTISALELKMADISGLGAMTEFLKTEQAYRLKISEAAKQLTKPWAKKGSPFQSARALLEVQSIGQAFKLGNVFEDKISSLLRFDLGDWRDDIKIDEQAMLDSVERTKLYVARGFDASLTDFPEPVYAENLSRAGLADNYLLNPYDFVPPPESPEEEAALKRGSFCHDLLTRLEIKLRRFVREKMQAQYGEKWLGRMPDMRDNWIRKAGIARKSGREVIDIIEMADFTDYEAVIIRKDHFEAVFKPFFKRKETVQESFRTIYPIRLASAHSRLPTLDDVLFLTAEGYRIFQIIKTA